MKPKFRVTVNVRVSIGPAFYWAFASVVAILIEHLR
jgi:hypothetical protein